MSISPALMFRVSVGCTGKVTVALPARTMTYLAKMRKYLERVQNEISLTENLEHCAIYHKSLTLALQRISNQANSPSIVRPREGERGI